LLLNSDELASCNNSPEELVKVILTVLNENPERSSSL
jgi:hypothetical protein